MPGKPQTMRLQVTSVLDGVAADAPLSFSDFLHALERVETRHLDPHLAGQHVPYEDRLRQCTVVRLETLADGLDALTDRFGLKARTGAPDDLLTSRHHIPKTLALEGAELERWLHAPVALMRAGTVPLPVVDTPRLAGTAIGARIRRIFAADYEAYGY
jgi:hypothetical protein